MFLCVAQDGESVATKGVSSQFNATLQENIKGCSVLEQSLSALECWLLRLDPVLVAKCCAEEVKKSTAKLAELAPPEPEGAYKELQTHLKRLLTMLDALMSGDSRSKEMQNTIEQLRTVVMYSDATADHISNQDMDLILQDMSVAETSDLRSKKVVSCVPILVDLLLTGLDHVSVGSSSPVDLPDLEPFLEFINITRNVVYVVRGVLVKAQKVSLNQQGSASHPQSAERSAAAAKELSLLKSDTVLAAAKTLSELISGSGFATLFERSTQPTGDTSQLGFEPLSREIRKIHTVVDSTTHAVQKVLCVLSGVHTEIQVVQQTVKRLSTILGSTAMQTFQRRGRVSAGLQGARVLQDDQATAMVKNVSSIVHELRKIIPGSCGSPVTVQLSQVIQLAVHVNG